jgi:F-type H+-transporting ATPase subunit b
MSFDATFWVAISFVLFVALIFYFKIPIVVNTALLKQINEIKKELDEAEKLKDDAKNLLGEYEDKISKSKNEIKKIIDYASKESEKNILETTKKFHSAMDRKKNSMNLKIELMKDEAFKETKNNSISIALESVEKIISSSIDRKKLDKLFNDDLFRAKEVLKKL